jgi:hypothetical protein
MGRPLNKKYFGNRNIGTTGTGDDGIGGEGLDAYTLAAQKGSIVINNTFAQPALTIPAPTIVGGVRATATVVWEVESVVSANGLAGNGYTVTTGGATTLTGLAGTTFNITAIGSGQGEVQTIVPVNRGEFTTVPTVAGTYQIVGGDGEQQATVKFRVKSITTVEKGSGYIAVPTLSWTTVGTDTGGTAVGAPTVTLTVDTGNVSSSTNQENAIRFSAITAGSTPRSNGDIISQKNARRFRVKTSDGTAVCSLVAATPSAIGEMAINATDSAGGTYWVTKLSNHKALIVQNTGTQFADSTMVQWTLSAPTVGVSVKVDNA